MLIKVVTPPQPIVLPAELNGTAAASDFAEIAIAAVTEELDGPTGSLGRALGAQVLELTLNPCEARWHFLPCIPIVEIQSVSRVKDGATVALDASAYRWDGMRICIHDTTAADAFKIRYRAGYDGTVNGDVPMKVKQAVILKARQMIAVLDRSSFTRIEETEGVGRWEYSLPDQVAKVINDTVDRLVAGLKVSQL